MRTLEEINNHAWHMAFGLFLSEYPEDKEPSEILGLIEEGDDSIVVWEPFEYNNTEWIVEEIAVTKMGFMSDLQWMQEGLK